MISYTKKLMWLWGHFPMTHNLLLCYNIFLLLVAHTPCFSAIHGYEEYLKMQQYNAICCQMVSVSTNKNVNGNF